MPDKTCKRCGKPNLTENEYCSKECEELATIAKERESRRISQALNEFYNPERARKRRAYTEDD